MQAGAACAATRAEPGDRDAATLCLRLLQGDNDGRNLDVCTGMTELNKSSGYMTSMKTAALRLAQHSQHTGCWPARQDSSTQSPIGTGAGTLDVRLVTSSGFPQVVASPW